MQNLGDSLASDPALRHRVAHSGEPQRSLVELSSPEVIIAQTIPRHAADPVAFPPLEGRRSSPTPRRPAGSAAGEWAEVSLLSARRPTVARRAVVDVDVVLVSRHGRARVLDCLDRLAIGTDGSVLSVTVVDNGSGDGTYEDVASRGDGTRVIDMGFDAGFATAANAGMARGRGRYILILDQDTIMTPGSLRSLVEFADRHPEGGAFAPRLLDGRGSPSIPDAEDELAFDVDWVPARAMLVPRVVHAATAGFDEGYFDSFGDRDWCRRIKQAGYSLFCVSTATAIRQDPPPADRSQQLAAIRSYHAGAYRYWRQHEAPPRWHPAHWARALVLAARGELAVLTSKAPPST